VPTARRPCRLDGGRGIVTTAASPAAITHGGQPGSPSVIEEDPPVVVNLIRRYGVLIAIVAVVAVIAVVGVVFRDRFGSNASELVVGDCFDEPGGVGVTVENVQHHPCTEAHTAEVFAVLNHPAGRNDPYPGTATLQSFAREGCPGPFASYVGISVDETTLDVGYFRPTEDGWKDGDRAFTCYLTKEDGSGLTQSMKGSKQ
jgi:hypothetical protein